MVKEKKYMRQDILEKILHWELDQLHQISSITLQLQLLCAKNLQLQLFLTLANNYKSKLQIHFE